MSFYVYNTIFKRLMDIMGAVAGLIVLALPMVAIGILIKRDSPGPVFFIQKRIGLNARPFMCYKFRTMTTDTPHDCPAQIMDHRANYVTHIGAILRKTSLDELPQLLNILKGEMSLIGPRPALYNEDAVIAKRKELGIYALRPGLSGLAQISGRNMITDEEKIHFDLEYLHCISLATDLKLIYKTVFYAFRGTGVKE